MMFRDIGLLGVGYIYNKRESEAGVVRVYTILGRYNTGADLTYLVVVTI